MNYTSLTWYEQEYLRYKAHFEKHFLEHRVLRVCSLWKLDHKDILVSPTGR